MIEKFSLEKSVQLNTVGAIAYENHEIGAIAESPDFEL